MIGKKYKTRDSFSSFYGNDKYADMFSNYQNNKYPIRLNGEYPIMWENKTDGCYVLNSNGEKFYSTFQYDRNKCCDFERDLKQYNFYETFEMNKYTATDKITLVIDFKGKPVHIELEKNQ